MNLPSGFAESHSSLFSSFFLVISSSFFSSSSFFLYSLILVMMSFSQPSDLSMCKYKVLLESNSTASLAFPLVSTVV